MFTNSMEQTLTYSYTTGSVTRSLSHSLTHTHTLIDWLIDWLNLKNGISIHICLYAYKQQHIHAHTVYTKYSRAQTAVYTFAESQCSE